jgi:HD superfamily phosphohydrolase
LSSSKKLFKDNIHGYISVESDFIPMINTAAFQRLRRLEQTSYRVLYPSASHDRFIHSLGVYYLGNLAYSAIFENQKDFKDSTGKELIDNMEKKLMELKKPFLTACLLHDIGHAPFSHTCEGFFNLNILKDKLLIAAEKHFCENPEIFTNFKKEVCAIIDIKRHEFMSSIILMEDKSLSVKIFLNNNIEHLDFAVRAILGCTYDINGKKDNIIDDLDLKNALIRILNSSLIDVDKLDYTVRDSVLSGYKNVEMDLPRLMSSYTLARKYDNSIKRERIWPAYKKSALSVIEHVFFARKNQIRWIQSHNAVVYETELLQRSLYLIKERISKEKKSPDFNLDKIFCYEALNEAGIAMKELNIDLRLLADEDILSLMKNYYVISEVKEYFNRANRKKAIWKTHDEFNATFNEHVEKVFKTFSNFLKKGYNDFTLIINNKNFDEILKDDKNIEIFKKFFKEIYCDVKDKNFELLFVNYNAEKFDRNFDAKEIFLVYDNICESYENIIKYNTEEKNISPFKKGFFIFYRNNGKKIMPREFMKAYSKYFGIADTPK